MILHWVLFSAVFSTPIFVGNVQRCLAAFTYAYMQILHDHHAVFVSVCLCVCVSMCLRILPINVWLP
jgi:hypothetical protein